MTTLSNEEIHEVCTTTTQSELKKQVKSIFGVRGSQMAVALGLTIWVLLLMFLFVFLGMQVFKGESGIRAFVNTGIDDT